MDRNAAAAEALLEKMKTLSERRADLRGLLVIGSRARKERPADKWSDLDLLLLTTHPQRYLKSTTWLKPLGAYSLTFLEGTVSGGQERRVLFTDGLDVDFNPRPASQIRDLGLFVETGKGSSRTARFATIASRVFRRGVRVVVDKDGFATVISVLSKWTAPAGPPSEAEFLNVVQDFLYHAVWTAKKLRRGELLVAKSCCDGYMKNLLTDMLECHARALHGWDYDTWHDRRFFEQWADPRAVEGLKSAFATYDERSVQTALLETLALFRWVALETAERLGYRYPLEGDAAADGWVNSVLAESG